MSSSWLNILTISPRCASEFTGWAIIEELSIRRRLRTFLINWGQKTHMKHCNVDLSSWYELWFAIICIDMDLILDLSTAIQQRNHLPAYPVSTQPAVGAAKHHRQDAYLTAMFGHYIGWYFNNNTASISPLRIDNELDHNNMIYSGWRPLAYCACVNRSAQSQSWHIFEATHTGSQTTASETVETLRVPTSPQGEHSLAESRYDHWWRLPDVYVGAKNSTGFPNTCRK